MKRLIGVLGVLILSVGSTLKAGLGVYNYIWPKGKTIKVDLEGGISEKLKLGCISFGYGHHCTVDWNEAAEAHITYPNKPLPINHTIGQGQYGFIFQVQDPVPDYLKGEANPGDYVMYLTKGISRERQATCDYTRCYEGCYCITPGTIAKALDAGRVAIIRQ